MTGRGVVVVRVTRSPADVRAAQAVRSEVFVAEQGVDPTIEQDGRDADAVHVLAEVDGVVVGAARLLVEPAAQGPLAARSSPWVGHLGRLAVLARARGCGVGAELVRGVEDAAAERGLPVVYLGAQVHALGFYAALGYLAVGEEYQEAGIGHRHMARSLQPR